MGYSLSIGELHSLIEFDKDEGFYDWASVVNVDGKPLGAPVDSRGLGLYENCTWPSYSAWGNFSREMGGAFYNMMFDELIVEHPGYGIVKHRHLTIAEKAQKNYRMRKPNRKDDWHHVRIDWLVWWMRWSLENCDVPVFVNS